MPSVCESTLQQSPCIGKTSFPWGCPPPLTLYNLSSSFPALYRAPASSCVFLFPTFCAMQRTATLPPQIPTTGSEILSQMTTNPQKPRAKMINFSLSWSRITRKIHRYKWGPETKRLSESQLAPKEATLYE